MKSRLAASLVLSALVLTGATGCTFITHQASTIPYSPSDGVNIDDTAGPLQVRNALIVATDDGELGSLVAVIVNPTDEHATLTVEIEGTAPVTVNVPAGRTVSLGGTDEPVRIDPLGVTPGATVATYFQSGDATGATAEVPVLDGTLPYYEDLLPSAMPTAEAFDED